MIYNEETSELITTFPFNSMSTNEAINYIIEKGVVLNKRIVTRDEAIDYIKELKEDFFNSLDITREEYIKTNSTIDIIIDINHYNGFFE